MLFNVQKPSRVEKGGRLIVGQPSVSPESSKEHKKEELTFYKTLTDKGNKAPSVVNPHQSKKIVQNSLAVDTDRPVMGREKRYTLQVGSFMEKNAAQKLVAKLVGKGYPAYLVKAQLAIQDIRYRVRVGSFGDKTQAKALAERLEKEEGLKSFIAYAGQGAQ